MEIFNQFNKIFAEKSASNRTLFIQENLKLTTCYQLILEALVSLFSRYSEEKAENISDNLRKRMSLCAHYFQGIVLTERLISEGIYFKACACLKQQQETIALINQIELGLSDSKPSIKKLKERFHDIMGPVNGLLNDVSHMSFKDISQIIVYDDSEESVFGASLVPVYKSAFSKELYLYFIAFLFIYTLLLKQVISDLFGGDYSSEENQRLLNALKLYSEA
jgi:hypothetical protein